MADLLEVFSCEERECEESGDEVLDPHGPVFDVVVVRPLSVYRMPDFSTASIIVLRRYLEDYLSLKGCGAVAVYYEERFSNDDTAFDAALGNDEGGGADLPGRLLWLQRVDTRYFRGSQRSEVAGCWLILSPRPQAADFTDPRGIDYTLEAGGKVAIGTRLKRAGMHWTLRGSNAIIALRCCKLSGRFQDFWERRSRQQAA